MQIQILVLALLAISGFCADAIIPKVLESFPVLETTDALQYNEYYTINVTEANIGYVKQFVQSKYGILVLLFQAHWCEHCKAFLPHYNLLARKFYKEGETYLVFGVVHSDVEKQLTFSYDVTEMPKIIIQDFTTGEWSEQVVYEDAHNMDALMKYLRKGLPQLPEEVHAMVHLEQIRKQAAHHVAVARLSEDHHKRKTQQQRLDLLQEKFPQIKFVHLQNDGAAPLALKDQERPSLHIWVHPLLEEAVPQEIIPLDFSDLTSAQDSFLEKYKQKVDFLDILSSRFYVANDTFERPIIAIASTHPSIHYPIKNEKFYKKVFKALAQANKAYPEFDYVLVNALELQDITRDMQLDEEDQDFYLLILEDPDTGYKYQGHIIQETESQSSIDTANLIKSFIQAYKNKELKPFLKSEKSPKDSSKFVKKIVGRDFEDVVTDQEKDVFVMVTVGNEGCYNCRTMANHFQKLAEENPSINFVEIDLEQNDLPKAYRQTLKLEKVPQFGLFKKGNLTTYERATTRLDQLQEFLEKQIGKAGEKVKSDL